MTSRQPQRDRPPHLSPSPHPHPHLGFQAPNGAHPNNAPYYPSSMVGSSSSTPAPAPAIAAYGFGPSGSASLGVGVEPDLSIIPDPEAEGEDEENIFRDMSFGEILEDLNARFLINLPKEEMSLVGELKLTPRRHWFYEDYLRPLNPTLPSLSQRQFTRIIIESSPLYAGLLSTGGIDYDRVWEEYCGYKRMVPCCGGILLNREGDKCLVVRGFKSNAGWSFPRGKINLDESEAACAIREVEEETGFDLTGMIHTSDSITTHINAQKVTMFIILGVDESTVFETQTRNEIGAIEWVRLSDLPTWSNKRGPKRTGGQGQKKFYNVTPFVIPLKKWLVEHGIDPYARPAKKKAQQPNAYRDLQPYQFVDPASPQPVPLTADRGVSTLDHLFARFVHKQEEELEVPEGETVVGSDNKAGLERLFGNLNVLKAEEQTIHASHGSHDQELQEKLTETEMEKERERNEDDALAKLLGAIGGPQTPVPEPPKPAITQKQNNLLSVLNMKSPQPQPSAHPAFQQHNSPAQAHGSPAKPHQAKLLAMISPQPAAQDNLAGPPINPYPTYINPTHTKPASLPPSPYASSPAPHDAGEAGEVERKAKARALLDMTFAGIGLDAPVNSVSKLDTFAQSQAHQQNHFPPQPGPIPQPIYGHHNPTQTLRIVSQPPQHSLGSQVQPQPRSTGYPGPAGFNAGAPPGANGLSSSPTKSSQAPPPYEAQAQSQLPIRQSSDNGGSANANGIYDPRQLQRPPGPVGPPLSGFRPSQPPHAQAFGVPNGGPNAAYAALQHIQGAHGAPFPPNHASGFGSPVGTVPGPGPGQMQVHPQANYHVPPPQGYRGGPPTAGPTHGYLNYPPQAPQGLPAPLAQGFPPQPQPQSHHNALLQQLQQPSQNQHQPQPQPLSQSQPHMSQTQQQQQHFLSQLQRTLPPHAHGSAQIPNVYQPVPRPPPGTGPGGLLAMLNGAAGVAGAGQGDVNRSQGL